MMTKCLTFLKTYYIVLATIVALIFIGRFILSPFFDDKTLTNELITTKSDYIIILKKSLTEKEALLKQGNRPTDLLAEIKSLQDKLVNKELSYQDYKEKIQQQITELEDFRDNIGATLFKQAEQAIYSGDSQKADKALEKIAKQAVNKAAKAFYLRGEIAYTAVNYTKAYQFYEQASDLEPDNTNYLNEVGILLYKLGDYPKALIFHNKALVIDKKQLGIDHPDTAATYNNLALLYQTMGDYDKALIFHNKALVINEKQLGTDHPDTAIIYNNLASLYQTTGDYDKALIFHNKALVISEKQLGTDHPDTATTYNNLAELYRAMGNYDKALIFYNKALVIREKHLGTDHPDTATTYNNLALLYKTMGDYDTALIFYNKALVIRKKHLGTDHPDTATTYNNLARLYYQIKEYKQAEILMIKAIKGLKKSLPDNHPNLKSAKQSLIAIQAELNKK